MAITQIGHKLIKYGARWMDFIAKLSHVNRAKIERAGLLKPVRDYVVQIERGTENMTKRFGYRVEHTGAGPDGIKASTIPNARLITTEMDDIMGNDIDNSLLRAIITRHEAYEMQAAERALRTCAQGKAKQGRRVIRRFEDANPDEIGRYNVNTLNDQMSKNRQAIYGNEHSGYMIPDGKDKVIRNRLTGHLSMDVLFKERKLIDRFPHPDNPAINWVRKQRNATGEHQYLDIAGNLGDPALNTNWLERFNKCNAREVLRNKKHPVFVNSAMATTLEPLF